jgi:acyl carrier protein
LRPRGSAAVGSQAKYRDTYTPESWQQQSGEERLKIFLMDLLDVPEKELVPSASLVEDLNADSLDLVELWFGLQEEFQIEILDKDFDKILTVGDTLNFLQEQGALERMPVKKK